MTIHANQTRAALEQAVRADLDAWAPWLVYADWLAERGDVRGRLIALAHRRAGTNARADATRLDEELAELTAAHEHEWAIPNVPDTWVLARRHAFVVGVTFTVALAELEEQPDAQLEPLAELLAGPHAGLLGSLRVRVTPEEDDGEFEEDREPTPIPTELVDALLELPLARIRELALEYTPIGLAGAERLAGWPGLARLRALNLRYAGLGDDGIAALVDSVHLPALERLWLQRNRIGPAGAARLVGASRLSGLRLLDLRDNPIGPAGAAALASSPNLAKLDALFVYRQDLEAEGMRALASSTTLPERIRRLWAGHASASDARRHHQPPL